MLGCAHNSTFLTTPISSTLYRTRLYLGTTRPASRLVRISCSRQVVPLERAPVELASHTTAAEDPSEDLAAVVSKGKRRSPVRRALLPKHVAVSPTGCSSRPREAIHQRTDQQRVFSTSADFGAPVTGHHGRQLSMGDAAWPGCDEGPRGRHRAFARSGILLLRLGSICADGGSPCQKFQYLDRSSTCYDLEAYRTKMQAHAARCVNLHICPFLFPLSVHTAVRLFVRKLAAQRNRGSIPHGTLRRLSAA